MTIHRRQFLALSVVSVPIAGCLTNGSGDNNATGETTADETARSGSTVTNTAGGPPSAAPTTMAGQTRTVLTADALGEEWTYAEQPTVMEDGTITATYRRSGEYTRIIEVVIWPCEGETLESLGGECSIEQYAANLRADASLTTTAPSIGENAIAWWSEGNLATDIEVVTDGYVFRLTHVPQGSTGPPRQQRLAALQEVATRLATHLSYW